MREVSICFGPFQVLEGQGTARYRVDSISQQKACLPVQPDGITLPPTAHNLYVGSHSFLGEPVELKGISWARIFEDNRKVATTLLRWNGEVQIIFCSGGSGSYDNRLYKWCLSDEVPGTNFVVLMNDASQKFTYSGQYVMYLVRVLCNRASVYAGTTGSELFWEPMQ